MKMNHKHLIVLVYIDHQYRIKIFLKFKNKPELHLIQAYKNREKHILIK